MNIRLCAAALAMPLLSGLCTAQPRVSQELREWGEPVLGVQVSIASTNTILTNGSLLTVSVQIRNRGTSAIFVAGVNEFDPVLFLTNNLGKRHTLTRDVWHETRTSATDNFDRLEEQIDAGDVLRGSLQVVIPKAVEPGDYELKAEQRFVAAEARRNRHVLTSNSLKVRIAK